jgi:hypothetical protein
LARLRADQSFQRHDSTRASRISWAPSFRFTDVPAFQPPSNVCRTVPKHNSPGGFAVAEKADGLTIREDQIRKVERDSFAVRYYVERNATIGPIENP